MQVNSSKLVFILGNHRCGTTWLYKLLADSGCFAVLTAWHVLNWKQKQQNKPILSRPELQSRFDELGISRRDLEDMPITPDLPEEYGYLLNNAGLGSTLSAKGMGLFSRLVDELSDERLVLLKNPWDYANLPFLAEHFPRARFIFIHRHPLRVAQSTVKVFRDIWQDSPHPYVELLSERYCRLWSNPLARWVLRGFARGWKSLDLRFVAHSIERNNRHYLRYQSTLPQAQCYILRYEDLCGAPNQYIHRILQFLQVQPVNDEVTYKAREQPRELSPEVAKIQKQLFAYSADYLQSYSYARNGEVSPWQGEPYA